MVFCFFEKSSCKIKVINQIVPFAIKLMGFKVNRDKFFIDHFAGILILASIQPKGNGQAFGGGRCRDQSYHGFIVAQRLSMLVGGDERKQLELNLVPLVGARRKMPHQNRQIRCVSQLLQPQLLGAKRIPFAASATGGNHKASGLRVQPLSLRTQTSPDGGHRKAALVVIGAPMLTNSVLRAIS
jgi:hypothetical protein